MGKNKRRLTLLILITVFIFSSLSVAAAAKKTVKIQGFTTNVRTLNKNAVTVKAGTTALTFAKGHGYIKFTAPKSKTYKFVFLNVKSKDSSRCAYASAQKAQVYNRNYASKCNLRLASGVSNTMWLSANGYKFSNYSGIEKPVAKRTGSVKLEKGETIYFFFNNGKKKTTVTFIAK